METKEEEDRETVAYQIAEKEPDEMSLVSEIEPL